MNYQDKKDNIRYKNDDFQSSNPYRKKRKPVKKKNAFLSFLYYAIGFLIFNSIIFVIVTSIPKFEIIVSEPTSYDNVEVTVQKKSFYPIKSIKATFNEEEVKLEKKGKNYVANISENGSFSVTVTNINGMSKTKNEFIVAMDDNPPILEVSSDNFSYNVTFSDDGSGIDTTTVYAVNEKGKRIKPVEIDEENSTAKFERNDSITEIYVSDKSGNTSVAHISEIDDKNSITNDSKNNNKTEQSNSDKDKKSEVKDQDVEIINDTGDSKKSNSKENKTGTQSKKMKNILTN